MAGPDLSLLSPEAIDRLANGDDPQSVIVADAEARHGIRPGLVGAILGKGERSQVNAGMSSKGAFGVGQLMPGTARDLGVDPANPVASIYGAARYTADNLKRFGGDERLAVAAYNAGPGAVARHGGVPPYPETQAYVRRVLGDGSQSGPDVSGLSQQQIDALANGDTSVIGAQASPPTPARAQTDAPPVNAINDATGETWNNQTQARAYQNLAKAGLINVQAPPGSKERPLGMVPGGQPPTGAWYVDLDGALKQAPLAAGDPGTPVGGLASGLRTADAAVRQGANALLGGWPDKLEAAASATPALITGGLASFQPAFSAALDRAKARDAADARDAPLASMEGGAAGFAAQGALVPEVRSGNLLVRGLAGAGQGGFLGAMNAAGDARGDAQMVVGRAARGARDGAAIGLVAGGLAGARPAAAETRTGLADYQAAGVDPMLATAGGGLAQQGSMMLKGIPVINAPLVRGAARTANQLDQGVMRVAGQLGDANDVATVGGSLQAGAQEARDALRGETSAIYAPVNQMAANPTRLPATNTTSAINDMFAAYPTIPDWLEQQAPKLRQVRDALDSAGGQVTFGELKSLRTDIGNLAADFHGAPVDKARLNTLYASLTSDMREGASTLGGEQGVAAFDAANVHNTQAQDTIQTLLDPLLKRGQTDLTPEAAFARIRTMASSKSTADIGQLTRLKQALPQDTWGDVASGVVANMGRDANGGFSPAVFATEMKKIPPSAKSVLFGEQAASVQSLANVAADQSAASRFYNHSNSGNLIATASAGGAIMHAVGETSRGNYIPSLVVAGLGGLGRAGAELMASPQFARLVMRSRGVSTATLDSKLASLSAANPKISGAVDTLRRAIANLPTTVGQAGERAVSRSPMPAQTGLGGMLLPSPPT